MMEWISVKERLPERMAGIWSMPLDIGGTVKFMDLTDLHIPTLSTTTKPTGDSKEEQEEDGLGLSPIGCLSQTRRRRDLKRTGEQESIRQEKLRN